MVSIYLLIINDQMKWFPNTFLHGLLKRWRYNHLNQFWSDQNLFLYFAKVCFWIWAENIFLRDYFNMVSKLIKKGLLSCFRIFWQRLSEKSLSYCTTWLIWTIYLFYDSGKGKILIFGKNWINKCYNSTGFEQFKILYFKNWSKLLQFLLVTWPTSIFNNWLTVKNQIPFSNE